MINCSIAPRHVPGELDCIGGVGRVSFPYTIRWSVPSQVGYGVPPPIHCRWGAAYLVTVNTFLPIGTCAATFIAVLPAAGCSVMHNYVVRRGVD